MKKLREKMNMGAIRLYAALQNERGDTNFISILIILGIVVVLAGVFIGFKDRIVAEVEKQVETLFPK